MFAPQTDLLLPQQVFSLLRLDLSFPHLDLYHPHKEIQ